jgi:3-hydroxyisobutyrate dehydrogenase-like beta-hydroxyacid dehydrogenase
LAGFEAAGAVIAGSPRTLAEGCEFVGVCVGTDDEVRDVVLREGDGILEGMASDAILILHSTIAPDTVLEVREAAARRGVKVIDAPVNGGPHEAEAGTLTVMVGGDAADFARARPLLQAFGQTISHLGPIGSGQLLKLLVNNLCYANMATSVLALELADAFGVDRNEAAALMATGPAGSHSLDIIRDEALLRRMTSPTSPLNETVDHLIRLAKQRGIRDNRLTAISSTAVDCMRAYVQRVGLRP